MGIGRTEKIIIGAMLGLLALLLVIGLDAWFVADWRQEAALVLERTHTASTTSTGTGVSADGKPVITTSNSPERWEVIVSTVNGEVLAVRATRAQWARAKKGTYIQVRHLEGWFGRHKSEVAE